MKRKERRAAAGRRAPSAPSAPPVPQASPLGARLLDLATSDPARKPPAIPIDQTLAAATALHSSGRLAEAEALYRRVLTAQPNQPEALSNLGAVLTALGRPAEAVASLEKAVTLRPDYADAHGNLGVTLQALGRLEAATAAYRRAIAARPDDPQAHYNLGNVLHLAGRSDEAAAAYRRALLHKPDHVAAHYNLGTTLMALGRLTEAVAWLEKAVALKPDYVAALGNLGAAYLHMGEHAAAEACHRRAIEREPGNAEAHRNLLAALLYKSDGDLAAAYAERLAYGRRFADSFAGQLGNIRDPRRRLRVGYLSSDLCDHPVGRLLGRIFAAHDRGAIEPCAYMLDRRADGVSATLEAQCAVWRDVAGLSDAAIAETIRNDGVDVLVCAAGHFDKNRVGICARRAAPVQASLFDGATSGVAGMDCFLTDSVLHPLDTPERFSETLARLPCLYIYTPPPAPATTADRLPSEARGTVTFGSFNNPAKLTARTLKLWGDVLGAVPGARLLLKFKNWFGDEGLRRRVLAGLGVDEARVAFAAEMTDAVGLRALYGDVDVALDPLPFNGATTTFEALSSGVPVVALAGGALVGRMAAAHLIPVGLGELVAADEREYVRIAAALAGDVARRRELRRTLPARLAASPLCDMMAFTRAIEDAYRALWRQWCGVVGSTA
jgi:predicted O-linked N-acetylglucosamine transferase (SPINDLY family)